MEMTAKEQFVVGQKVWWRGAFSDNHHQHRGVIERIDETLGSACIGVRLDNGNFYWSQVNQVVPRTSNWA